MKTSKQLINEVANGCSIKSSIDEVVSSATQGGSVNLRDDETENVKKAVTGFMNELAAKLEMSGLKFEITINDTSAYINWRK